MPTEEFQDLLAKTTEAFRHSDLAGHSTTTFDGIQTKFEFADKRKQVINRICEELAEEIERMLEKEDGITNIGFDEVRLNIMRNGDHDSIFVECDVWEEYPTLERNGKTEQVNG